MKILRELIQGTDEWLEVKKGKVSASNAASLLTPVTAQPSATMKKYAKQLALELAYEELKAGGGFKSAAMEDGNEREELARQLYQEYSLCAVEEVGIMLSDCENFAYSPDGLVGDDGLVEIKNLEAEAHSNILLERPHKMPSAYKCQVQFGLWVSGREWCDFIALGKIKDPEKSLIVIRQFRDEPFIEKLEEEAHNCIFFRDQVLQQLK